MSRVLLSLFFSLIINVAALQCCQQGPEYVDVSCYNARIAGSIIADVWGGVVEAPKDQVSVSDFVGKLAKAAREGGSPAVIAFLGGGKTLGFCA